VNPFFISDDHANQYADKMPPWGFNGLGYVTYKRTYARPIFEGDTDVIERTEEWHETIQRVVNGAQGIGAQLTQDEAERLYDYLFNLKGSVAGRMLWQLGTPNNQRLGGDSLVNCWFVDVQKPTDFSWAVERLMLGGGVGFSCDKPERIGVVRSAWVSHQDANDSDFIVPDTREGWAELIRKVFECYLGDDDNPHWMTYATHLIRPAGVPIKTFGGTASGPDILISGVEKICKVLDGAVGRTLTSVEVLDCMNIIGSIVVAGNVRRSAEIAVGRLDDEEYLMAKRWDLGDIPIERAMSNNTVFVSPEEMQNMPDLIWEGYKGNGEPYGFFNLEASRKYGRMGEERPDPSIVGVNPCAEIPLANRESCNLSEIFLPMIDSPEQLKDVAKLLYKVQKATAALSYLDPTSDKITSQNMRLGLGITGVAQALDKIDWLDEAYTELRELDAAWSAERGWPESVRLTTIKPSGTLSLLPGVTPGVHPGFSQYFVKRMRMASTDVLVNYCRSKGFYVEPLRNFDGSEDHRTVVVEFPCAFPEGTILAENMTAIEQMDLVRRLQKVWADNSISVTVYYKSDELDGIRDYLAKYWHEMKSVSFLLHSEHGFDQAPMGELTKDEYETVLSTTSPLGEKLSGSTIMSDDEFDAECATGACPIR
jgi:ribonucleoside-triphosphate reductase